MKLFRWLAIIFVLIAAIIAYLWFNGTIEKYVLRYAIEHGDESTILKLLRKGVRPDFYNR